MNVTMYILHHHVACIFFSIVWRCGFALFVLDHTSWEKHCPRRDLPMLACAPIGHIRCIFSHFYPSYVGRLLSWPPELFTGCPLTEIKEIVLVVNALARSFAIHHIQYHIPRVPAHLSKLHTQTLHARLWARPRLH